MRASDVDLSCHAAPGHIPATESARILAGGGLPRLIVVKPAGNPLIVPPGIQASLPAPTTAMETITLTARSRRSPALTKSPDGTLDRVVSDRIAGDWA